MSEHDGHLPVLSVSDRTAYSARAISWVPAVAAVVVGSAVVAVLHDREAGAPLQAVSILLASAAAFALDDPATETLAASPTSLTRRRIARLSLAGPPLVAAWLALVAVQGPADWAEAWALAAMFAGLLGLSLSISGIAARRSARGRGGIVAGPGLFILLVASTTIPRRWRPLPTGDVPGGWPQIYLRWSAAAAIGLVVFLWSSRDPARRRTRPRVPGTSAALAAFLLVATACTSRPASDGNTPSPTFEPARAAELQRALETSFAALDVPGVQAAVVAADDSVWSGAAGLAEIEHEIPMTSDRLMVPASISKVYTATLIALLAQEGTISLDDPITEWLPVGSYGEGVTIRHLVNHTSGIASDDPTLTPVCDPGTCQSYSNSGYNLLGQIVEEASGMSYADFLRARISRPLGLRSTFVPLEESVVGEPATGYDASGAAITSIEVEESRGGPDQVGAGGVLATASDVVRFIHALLTGDILEPEQLDELLDFEAVRGLPGSTECAAEAAVIRHSGTWGESWFHGGLAGSFRAWFEHYPRFDVTVVAMVNSGGFFPGVIEAVSAAALDGADVADPGKRQGRCVYDIAVRAPDGTTRMLTRDDPFDGFPSWTPRGRVLWSKQGDASGDVFLADGAGTAPPRRLTHRPANEIFPRWSPTRAEIVFASNVDGDFELFLMAPDGSRVEQLTRNRWDDFSPAWSPDGERIAFVRYHDGSRVLVIDRDGTEERAVTSGPEDDSPAWSPDGGRIVYEAGGVLLVVPIEGGEPVRVPIQQIRVTAFPSWAPNGAIVFQSDFDLWSARPDGSRLRRLTATSTEESTPAWGPDGSITYQIGRWVD